MLFKKTNKSKKTKEIIGYVIVEYSEYLSVLKSNNIRTSFFDLEYLLKSQHNITISDTIEKLLNRKNIAINDRIFKVAATIESDKENPFYDENLVQCNGIRVLESIPLLDHISKEKMSELLWIDNEEELKSISTVYKEEPNDFYKYKFYNKMRELGFSEQYSSIKMRELNNTFFPREEYEKFYKMAEALVAEKVSKDLLIYTLEYKNKK